MAIYVFLIFGHSVHVGSGQPAHDCWLSFVGITRVGHARFGSGPAAPARVMNDRMCLSPSSPLMYTY